MHILFVTISYSNSYNEQSHLFFHDQAKSLAMQNQKVGVVSAVAISLKDVVKKRKLDFGLRISKKDGVSIYLYQYPAIPKFYWLTNKIGLIIGKKLFKKYLKENNKPDKVHTQVCLAGGISLWIKNKYNIPYVVTEHYTSFLKNSLPKWKKNLALKTYQNSNYNIAVSKVLADKLQQDFLLNFEYVPNMVDTYFFKPSKVEKDSKGIKSFLNVGITKHQKNQGMLIKAFTEAFKNKSEFQLIIAGSGEDFEKLKKLVEKLNMQNQITLFGQATRKQVLNLMQNSDYFVLSSHYETFGVVLIEAMACGLPVVSTKSGGPESIITNPNLGILCENNISSLSNAMINIICSDTNKHTFRTHVVMNFSNSVIAERLIKIYETNSSS